MYGHPRDENGRVEPQADDGGRDLTDQEADRKILEMIRTMGGTQEDVDRVNETIRKREEAKRNGGQRPAASAP